MHAQPVLRYIGRIYACDQPMPVKKIVHELRKRNAVEAGGFELMA